MTRCHATRGAKRCRLDVDHHQRDSFGRLIHKFWNPETSFTWVELPALTALSNFAQFITRYTRRVRPDAWLAVAAVVIILTACLAITGTVNPDNFNTSDQETGFSCSLGADTSTQLTHEYASCVHVVYSDIESWH
jgi:hypothetical protein